MLDQLEKSGLVGGDEPGLNLNSAFLKLEYWLSLAIQELDEQD